MAITQKRQRFIDAYVETLNAAEAARRAGYTVGNARNTADCIRRDPEVAAEIERRLAENSMPPSEILARLAEHARGDVCEYLTPAGLDVARILKDGRGHLVKSIKRGVSGMAVETYDAQAALVQLGRHYKLWTDKHDVDIVGRMSDEELLASIAGEIAGGGEAGSEAP